MSYGSYRPSGFAGLTPVVKNLLIINVLFYIGTWSIGRFTNGQIDLTKYLAIYYPASEHFGTWQFVTYMFMHSMTDFSHILFNMFAVWMFGNTLEQVWGPKRFLTFYLVTGIGAAFIHLLVIWFQIGGAKEAIDLFTNSPTPQDFEMIINDYFKSSVNPQKFNDFVYDWNTAPDNIQYIQNAKTILYDLYSRSINTPTVGASGAVFGLLLAFGMLFPNSLIYLYFAIPVKAKYFVIGYGALELYLGFSNSGGNIAHFAHLGGMIFGFFLIKYWKIR
jgi:membrane associated rhomboid family serine protease